MTASASKVTALCLLTAGVAMAGLAAVQPTRWIGNEAKAAVQAVQPAEFSNPTGAVGGAQSGWLPVMGLVLPASSGTSLATGSRIKAVEAGSGRFRDLEVVDWVAVDLGANAPAVVVLARDADDAADGTHALIRLIVTLSRAPEGQAEGRAQQL